ncbi:hypothetical protein [Ruminococcus bromii]|uniref:hypothetical protein n=1 Tax=Ruminococcus bromii TaxID=40518 RepID=UPI00399A83AC
MFKKALSLLLSMMLVVTSLVVTVMSVSAAGDTYFVSGCEELTGYKWAETEATCGDNVMTANGDGNYEKVFTNVAVGNGYQFKVVKNDGEEWIGIGDGYEQNFTFNVKTACDVTVTFNPTTKEINVTGDGVDIPKDLVIDHVTAVGNGFGEWLHAKDWKLDADVNNLTETSEGSKVYQITYENLDAYENYEFKFAANSSWADNWGLAEAGGAPLNEWFDLTYNGQNMVVDTDEAGYDDGYDMVLTLDLSNFSYATKQGARCKIDIVTGDKPTEPATEEPTTVAAPTTVAPTTAAPETEPATEPATEAATTAAAENGLTVKATSNLFPEKKIVLSPDQKTFKVTYVFQSKDKDVLDFQWFMYYDSNVLKPTDNTNKSTSFEYPSQGSYMFNKKIPGEIGATGTNLSLYNSTSKEIVFASAEFEVIDPSATETTVNLDAQVLRLSKVDPDTDYTITEEEVEITNFGLNQENYDKFVTVCKTDSAPVSSEETTVAPTTEEATTVAPTTEEVTTVAPTTEEATTVAPTTEEPTEVPTTEEATTAPATEPTTVAPTTEPTTEPAPAADPIYVVAGSEEFAGLKWIGDPVGGAQNVMTKDGDLYTKTFTATPAGKDYQIKVVKNVEGTDPETGDKVWNQTWFGIGEEYKDNLTFNVTDTCDVTVTFNPATNEINVTGDNVKVVTDLEVEYITAVGNGYEGWLNGVAWGVDAASNKMDKIADKVYKISYTNVVSSDSYEFKFAANGSWAASWGLPAEENGAPVGENYALTYNGENMVLDTVALGYEEGTPLDVTLTLDLTNFDYPSKQGAKAFIQVTPQAPSDEATITASSNICQANGTGTYKVGDKVSVYYVLDTKDAQVEDVQWKLSFDKDALELNSLTMPAINDGLVNTDSYEGNASSLSLYDFAGGKKLVEAVFTVKAAGETKVNLNVVDLTLAKLNADTGHADEGSEYEAVVNSDIANDIFDNINSEAKVEAYVEPTTTEPATTEPTTTEPTTVAPETTEPTTVAPETTEPTTVAPEITEPTTVEPETTEPTTVAPETTEPTTVEPATVAPETTEPTDAPATVAPTTPDATSGSQAAANGQSTADTATPDTPANGTGSNAVQTGNASMAIVILLALISATGVVYFTRKRFTK